MLIYIHTKFIRNVEQQVKYVFNQQLDCSSGVSVTPPHLSRNPFHADPSVELIFELF